MSSQLLESHLLSLGGHFADVRGLEMAVHYDGEAREYAAAVSGAGIYAASDRGVIEVRGRDRAAWLHNLTTNAVKTLQPGEGNYTFAVNVKGRILMDFNVLVLGDALWVDLDRRLIAKALAHFDRYIITEDVQCLDRSTAYSRIALLGPQAFEIADALGATHVQAMPALASVPVPLAGKHRLLVRHDFAGVFGVEFHVDATDAPGCWDRLMEIGRPVGLRPVGWASVNALRMEAGIPWYGPDIDDDTLPAETGQIERGISYVKGCYLGQEVVERMRSRGALARRLVGLKLTGGEGIAASTPLQVNGQEVGRLTSLCRSLRIDAWIGLGYVKSAYANPGTRVDIAGSGQVVGEVSALPIVS